jgi:hypothetical protein
MKDKKLILDLRKVVDDTEFLQDNKVWLVSKL